MEKRNYLLQKTSGKNAVIIKLDPDVFYELLDKKINFVRNKYARIHINGKDIALSRYILKLRPGQGIVDHINRDPKDNRRTNLRMVDLAKNNLNRSKNKTAAIGFYGVRIHRRGKNCYIQAQLKIKNFYDKSFNCRYCPEGILLAALARDKMVVESGQEDYAPMNFPFFRIEVYKRMLLETDLYELKRKILIKNPGARIQETV